MDASSSVDEFASADEFASDGLSDGCGSKRFSPAGLSSGKLPHQTAPLKGLSESGRKEDVESPSGTAVSGVAAALQQACVTEQEDNGADADAEDGGSESDTGGPEVDPLASRDLDSGNKVQLFKVTGRLSQKSHSSIHWGHQGRKVNGLGCPMFLLLSRLANFRSIRYTTR